MTGYAGLDGPIYYGGAVVTDGVVQVAWVTPSFAIALRDPLAGWRALNHGVRAAGLVNQVVKRVPLDD